MTREDRAELDNRRLRRLHLDAVALQRQYPELLGPRTLTRCPYDLAASGPIAPLASFMRANLKRGTA